MFESILAEVAETDHRFTVYTEDGAAGYEGWFANYGVEFERKELPEGIPEPFLAVEREGSFVGALPLSTVESLLEPPITRPEAREGLSPAYRALFDVLDQTIYTSMERDELMAITREIEDRAERVGTGTLDAGFQRFSVLRPQVPTYRRLGATGLDVHVYGVDDWTPPAIPGVSYHACSPDSLGRYWLLAFDGGGDADQACALLARETDDGFTGFWTDEPATVAEIQRRLVAARE